MKKKIILKESELTSLIKRVIKNTSLINEQGLSMNICNVCKAYYAFSASKRDKYCTGANGVCNGGPMSCQLCKHWYSFSSTKRDKYCNCNSCPCGTGGKYLGVDSGLSADEYVDEYVDDTMDHRIPTSYDPETRKPMR